MNLRMTVGFSLCVASLMGCPTTETGTDAGVRTDAFVVAADAPGGSDAPGGADAPSATDAFVASDTGPAVTWATVHTSLQTSCAPCHSVGGSGGHNIAATDEMMSYTDSQLPSTICSGLTKGACAAMRVRNGSMPAGGPLPEPARTNLANLLDQWVAGGQMR